MAHALRRAAGALLAAALGLWPIVASAHELTADDLRAGFAAQGAFAVDAPTHWDWTAPPVTTLHLRDQGDRDVILLVYPDAATAETAAASPEPLVPGYGPSVTIGNVAVVQASRRALGQLDSATLTALCVGGPVIQPGASGVAVDADILARVNALTTL